MRPLAVVPTVLAAALVAAPATAAAPVAVVGHVRIAHTWSTGPVYALGGTFADPTAWSCQADYPPEYYRVRCVPRDAATWTCDVLYADVVTAGTGVAGATADCDDGAVEARTAVVAGDGGFDAVATTSGRTATVFTCTADRGGGYAATPDYTASCAIGGALS